MQPGDVAKGDAATGRPLQLWEQQLPVATCPEHLAAIARERPGEGLVRVRFPRRPSRSRRTGDSPFFRWRSECETRRCRAPAIVPVDWQGNATYGTYAQNPFPGRGSPLVVVATIGARSTRIAVIIPSR